MQTTGARTCKLEELFEDDPFLSPTMRARQLSQRLAKLERPGGAAPRSEAAPARAAPIPISEAIRCLRGPGSCTPEQAEQVRRFGEQTLSRWLDYLPDPMN